MSVLRLSLHVALNNLCVFRKECMPLVDWVQSYVLPANCAAGSADCNSGLYDFPKEMHVSIPCL